VVNVIAIKTSDLTQDFKSVADRVMKGEKVIIARPRNENLVLITEQEYNELSKEKGQETSKPQRIQKRLDTLKSLQDEVKANGQAMTDDEIIQDIKAYREEKRRSQ